MTALQELIAKWESDMSDPNIMIYKSFIEDAISHLDKEKQQIIDAYWAGLEGPMNDYSEAVTVGSTTANIKYGGGGEKYFNDNYKAKL